jgi:RecA-family ATPase
VVIGDARGSPTFTTIRDAPTFRDGKKLDDTKYTRGGFTRTCFDYELPDTTLLYQSAGLQAGVDFKKKRYLIRRPVNLARFDRQVNVGECVFGTGPRRVIYNWPAVMRAGPGATVFVTEGEKNARDLIKRGLLATTVICHDWTEECIAALAGYNLLILEDHDDHGRKIAARAQKLLAKVAKTTRIVPCAHLWKHLHPDRPDTRPPEHGDVSDFLYSGGDATKLFDICSEIAPAGIFSADVHDFPAEETIAPWEFLYGKSILRGTVTLLSGRGETGKSSKMVTDALAMTTGRKLLHAATGFNPLRVLLVNLEDTKNTLDKRIQAAMNLHDVTKEEVEERLFTIGKDTRINGHKVRMKLVATSKTGFVRDDATVRGLIAFLKENQIDVLLVDPLRKFHSVSENDNVAMGEVIEVFEDVAEEANCAVFICHHTRKGNGAEVSIDSARGASSITDAPRFAEVADKMTSEEAKKLGIAEERRRFYFKIFNGKANFVPPVEKVDWFELKTIELHNASFGNAGDAVGVVSRWVPPAARDVETSSETIRQVREMVGTEPRWKENPQADMWVGKAVGPVVGLDPTTEKPAVKNLIAKLVAAKVLKTVTSWDRDRGAEKLYMVAVEDDTAHPASSPLE